MTTATLHPAPALERAQRTGRPVARAKRLTANTAKAPASARIKAATSVHPMPIVISLGCAAWFVFISWAVFATADAETALSVAVVTIIFAMMLGGLTWGAAMAPDRAPDHTAARSFAAFLDGHADIATGLVSGREALIQIAMLPLTLAIGGTVIALIWAVVR